MALRKKMLEVFVATAEIAKGLDNIPTDDKRKVTKVRIRDLLRTIIDTAIIAQINLQLAIDAKLRLNHIKYPIEQCGSDVS